MPLTNQIKSPLYRQYHAEACNEWRNVIPRLSAWTTQHRRNIAAVASRWRQCVQFDLPKNQTYDVPSQYRVNGSRYLQQVVTKYRSIQYANTRY